MDERQASRGSPSIPIGYCAWAATAFLCLLTYVITNHRPVFWDEVPYHSRAIALASAHSFREWLLDNAVIPAGPAHALMSYAVSGGHGTLPVPWVRLPNVVLLAFTVWLLADALRRVSANPLAALLIFALPMVWVVTGIAITEPLGLFGIALALAATLRLRETSDLKEEFRCGLMVATGFAIATTTRQLYVVVAPALVAMNWPNRRQCVAVALSLALGVIPFVVLVGVWRGLVPPKLAYVGSGVAPVHAFLAFALTGTAVLIMAPQYFLSQWRLGLAAGVIGTLTVFVFRGFHPTTLTSVQRLWPAALVWRIVERLIGGLFVGAGFAFLAVTASKLWRCRDAAFTGAAVGVLTLCAACAAVVHQFSSRYAVMGLPLLVLMIADVATYRRWALVRLVAGSAVGLAILHSYFVFA